MNKECELVKDLLIGYSDNTLHTYSRQLVEEHLKKCSDCSKILSEITNDTDSVKENKEIDYLKKVNKKFTNKKIIITIISSILSIFIIFNLIIFYNYYKSPTKIEIFFDNQISNEELEKINQELKSNFENIEISTTSSTQELAKLKENHKKSANILDGYNENNNPFPASFSIQIPKKQSDELITYLDQIKQIKQIRIIDNPYLLFFNSDK